MASSKNIMSVVPGSNDQVTTFKCNMRLAASHGIRTDYCKVGECFFNGARRDDLDNMINVGSTVDEIT